MGAGHNGVHPITFFRNIPLLGSTSIQVTLLRSEEEGVVYVPVDAGEGSAHSLNGESKGLNYGIDLLSLSVPTLLKQFLHSSSILFL